jgi:hypothetical protein
VLTNLDENDIDSWRGRFFSFNDGVIRRCRSEFVEGGFTIDFDVEAQDAENAASGWSLVSIRLLKCSSIRVAYDSNISFDVLSNGIHILSDGTQIGLEFGEFADEPQSLAELMTSPRHAVAAFIEWSVRDALPD